MNEGSNGPAALPTIKSPTINIDELVDYDKQKGDKKKKRQVSKGPRPSKMQTM